MLGLNLKDGLLVVLVVFALVGKHVGNLEQRIGSLLQSLTNQGMPVNASHYASPLEIGCSSEQKQTVELEESRRHGGQEQHQVLEQMNDMMLDIQELMGEQIPIVLQNLSKNSAYNGHVGRVRNITGSSVLVAVHGVFFGQATPDEADGFLKGATPLRIKVKRRHIRPLDKAANGNAVQMHRVTVEASSTRGDFPLSAVLDENDKTWWISKPGSFSQGRGSEYLEFQFRSFSVVRVLGLSIPPLPMGPLSVREFSVKAFVNKTWVPVSPLLRTLDKAGFQEFAIEPVTTRRLRVVCSSTAAEWADVVGLFDIAFF
jgi:hypothetical protein